MCADALGSVLDAPVPDAAQERLAAIGARMILDHWTGSVTADLRAAGIDTVLLKGPAIARWLYDDPHERDYGDADLLVRHADLSGARGVLAGLGFELIGDAMAAPWDAAAHAETWVRRSDGATVDLHRCLHHLEHLPGEMAFELVWTERDSIELAGQAVDVPSEAVRALHVVLHLQPKDDPGSRAWTDLERALERIDDSVWRDAAAIADACGVGATMGPLLRMVPAGSAVADHLGLPVEPSEELVRHHRRHAPGLVRLGHRLHGLDARARAALVRSALVPAADAVRASYPVARSGMVGLGAAYLWRAARLPLLAGRALRHQARQRRGARLR